MHLHPFVLQCVDSCR